MTKFWIKYMYGGVDASEAVGGVIHKIGDELERLEKNNYSPTLKEFGINLWVDGKISRTKVLEDYSVRVYPKRKSVIFYITIREKTWKKGPNAIKEYFQSTLLTAFEAAVDKALERKIKIESKKLLKDLNSILNKI